MGLTLFISWPLIKALGLDGALDAMILTGVAMTQCIGTDIVAVLRRMRPRDARFHPDAGGVTDGLRIYWRAGVLARRFENAEADEDVRPPKKPQTAGSALRTGLSDSIDSVRNADPTGNVDFRKLRGMAP